MGSDLGCSTGTVAYMYICTFITSLNASKSQYTYAIGVDHDNYGGWTVPIIVPQTICQHPGPSILHYIL